MTDEEAYDAAHGIKPTTRALVNRGNVTLDEWKALRINSAERDLLYPRLSDEAFAFALDIVLVNCSRPRLHTYEHALSEVLVPQLLQRFRKAAGLGHMEVDEPPSHVL